MDPCVIRTSILLISDGGPLVKDFEAMGIPVTLIRKRWRYDFSIIWKIRRFLKSGQYDIVHTHLFTADFWGRLGALFMDSAIISSAHNVISTEKTMLNKVECFLDRVLVQFTDIVLCVSPQVNRSLQHEVGLPREKLVTIENGIDISLMSGTQTRKEARTILGISGDSPVVTVIGRFFQQKNHRTFLKSLVPVYGRYPDLTVLLVGEGELEKEIRNDLFSYNLGNAVRLLGIRRDIPTILNATDILMIPSLWEGLPIVLLEAIFSRTPVVATRVGGIPDVVTDQTTGLLCQPDAESLSSTLLWALDNPERMNSMAQTAYATSHEKYDIRRTAQRYIDLYRSVLKKRSSGHEYRNGERPH